MHTIIYTIDDETYIFNADDISMIHQVDDEYVEIIFKNKEVFCVRGTMAKFCELYKNMNS